jgi:hypothetical protein
MREIQYLNCVECGQPFTDKNVHSQAGWLETQISGFCEDCFDALFDEDEDEDEPEDDEEPA